MWFEGHMQEPSYRVKPYMSNGLNIETWPGVAEIEPTRRTEKLSGNTLLNTAKFKDEKREKNY